MNPHASFIQFNSIQFHQQLELWNVETKREHYQNENVFTSNSFLHAFALVHIHAHLDALGHAHKHSYSDMCMNKPQNGSMQFLLSKMNYITTCVFHDIWLAPILGLHSFGYLGYNGINTIFHITSKMKNTWNVFTTDLVRHFFFFLLSLFCVLFFMHAVSQMLRKRSSLWSRLGCPYLVHTCVCMCFVVKKPQKNRQRPEEHYVKLKRGLKLNFNVVVSCTENLITKHHSCAIRVGCRMHL